MLISIQYLILFLVWVDACLGNPSDGIVMPEESFLFLIRHPDLYTLASLSLTILSAKGNSNQ